MDKGRSSRQDNTSREGVGAVERRAFWAGFRRGLANPLRSSTPDEARAAIANAAFGRWPWSWPVEVPVRVRRENNEVVHLVERGTIYDFAANVGSGYTGTMTMRSSVPGLKPPVLEVKVGRGYLRSKLRSGAWQVVPDLSSARTSADTPSTDCPSSQSKDAT